MLVSRATLFLFVISMEVLSSWSPFRLCAVWPGNVATVPLRNEARPPFFSLVLDPVIYFFLFKRLEAKSLLGFLVNATTCLERFSQEENSTAAQKKHIAAHTKGKGRRKNNEL